MPSPRTTPNPASAVALPAAPALVAGVKQAAWLSPDGELALLPFAEAARRARAQPPFLCHARATARRMGVLPFPALDLLELYAFVRPARFCLPTPRGLAEALELPLARRSVGDEALSLVGSAQALLAELSASAEVPAFDVRLAAIGLSALLDGLWLESSLNPRTLEPQEAIALCRDWIEALCAGALPALRARTARAPRRRRLR